MFVKNTCRCLKWAIIFLPFFSECKTAPEEKDALTIMTYNVLKYGNGCQGANGALHAYLRTIVKYCDPDVLGLVKVAAIPVAAGDKGKAPIGFADSILNSALNTAYPGRYACCPFTNAARDNDGALLFYNKNKLGLASYVTLVSDLSDIDMYKLYYMGEGLATKRDTSFLYIVLLHTDSGDDPKDRNRQVTELMAALRKTFTTLPNIIVMGDFNLRKASEDGYQSITANADKKKSLLDPPFAIDHTASYPANWDKHPERFAAFLTTSTREKKKEPNDCGTGGGAKDWYDHIFLSPSLSSRNNFYHYIRGSYKTIGNDGKRIDVSVNKPPNSSAPPEVLDALYQMSNKYPVLLKVGVSTGK